METFKNSIITANNLKYDKPRKSVEEEKKKRKHKNTHSCLSSPCLHVLLILLFFVFVIITFTLMFWRNSWAFDGNNLQQTDFRDESMHIRLGVAKRNNDKTIEKKSISNVNEHYQVNKPTKPSFAIISSYLPSSQYDNVEKVGMLDHLVNKACYCYLWGYDFIFNMSNGFNTSNVQKEREYWLEYGTWHRVPHIRDRIREYDWILYADIDYVIQDMVTPLDSFLVEFELHDRHPSIFIPKDFNDMAFTFSAFAVMIKNSAFGNKVLDYWMEFSQGICKNGNFHSGKRKYQWEDSDQPGLWYALMKAHMDFQHKGDQQKLNSALHMYVQCNEKGLIQTERELALGPEMNKYFRKMEAIRGNAGIDLFDVPDNQPIIWSLPKQNTSRAGGLGLQLNWGGPKNQQILPFAFAIHMKDTQKWPTSLQHTVSECKQKHGCYAAYDKNGKLQIGCNNVKYAVSQ